MVLVNNNNTTLDNAVTISASGDSEDTVDTVDFNEALIVVDVTAKTGGTPTLVPEVQISLDGTNFVHRWTIIDEEDLASYVDLTRTTAPTNEGKIGTEGQYVAMLKGQLGTSLKINYTLGGTGTPTFDVTTKIFLR